MNAICRDCPGLITGDCAHCDVLRDDHDWRDRDGEDGDYDCEEGGAE